MFTDQEKKENIIDFIARIANIVKKAETFDEERALKLPDLVEKCFNIMKVRNYTTLEFNQLISSLNSENSDEFGKVSREIIKASRSRNQPATLKELKPQSKFLTPDEIHQNVFLPFLNSKIIDSKELSDKKDQVKEMLSNLIVVSNGGEEGYDIKRHLLILYKEVLIGPKTLLSALQEIKTRAAEKLIDTRKEEKFSKFKVATKLDDKIEPSEKMLPIFKKDNYKKPGHPKKM